MINLIADQASVVVVVSFVIETNSVAVTDILTDEGDRFKV